MLRDYVEGTDTTFNATSGGTGLGGTTWPYFQGVTVNNAWYFTDRAGALRKYQETPPSGDQVRSVALPTRPSAAPGVKARTYEILDQWAGNSGAAPFGWTVADNAKFDLQDGTSTVESPLGGTTALLNTLTNPKNSPITENVSAESLPSNTIAWWEYGSDAPTHIVFQYGTVTATDFTEQVEPLPKEQWLPRFINVGSLGSINYKRFLVVQNTGAADTYVSKIVLPGKLQGSYRWRYTHYDPTLGRESEPSDIGNSGVPLDLSMVGVTGQTSTAAAFQKSAAITFTSDSGSDTTTTQIRVYRSGGVRALTIDERGVDVWARVGTVLDFTSQVNGNHSAGDTTIVLDSVTGLAVNDWLVFEKGTVGSEEYGRITAIDGGTATVTLSQGITYAHNDNASVQVCFVDNVSNTEVDLATRIYPERDDPPSATLYLARSPDGRLWGFNYSGRPTGVWVSNRATPERPTDYEVAPDGVDPNTRADPLQGWRFEIGGDVTDEEIVWGGFFRDRPYALTRRRLYVINALSQVDWGPDAVVKALEVGCIAGDTVAECNGVLYWVADGPRVMRWDGQTLEDISHQRVNERLAGADLANLKTWFGLYHAREEGTYYRLYYALAAEAAASSFSPLTAPEMLFGLQSDSIDLS